MALVVFMRGVNVGGHKAFKPAALASELAAFDVVNVGAAGTFVVRGKVAEATLRAELLRRLPFEAELMTCQGRELLELAKTRPFGTKELDAADRPFLTVMAKPPRMLPKLPISQPSGDAWQVKITAVVGRFALSLWRRQGRTLLYPNEVVEKRFEVPATTRNWNTVSTICEILKEPG